MREADIDFADSVRAIVGWNQTRRDWQRLLSVARDGAFVAEWSGQPAGVGLVTSYGLDLAWVGMLLVHPDFRRRGIGQALLDHCVAHARARGVRCVKLDATPMGKLLYDQRGFIDEWILSRWQANSLTLPALESTAPSRENSPPQISLRPLAATVWPQLLALDQIAFGTSRRESLETLAAHCLASLVALDRENKLTGFGMIRAGARANYLGPIVAQDSSTALALANALLRAAPAPSVFWDLPDQNADAIAFAKSAGFTHQRALIRMFVGENHCPGQPAKIFGLIDPALG
jgi:GNAT superfamily N-acetyltransferase